MSRYWKRDGHDWRRLRWQLLQTIAPSRRIVRSRGLRFTLQADNWMTHFRWQTYNTKEPDTLDWIDQWGGADGLLFDIGANIGVYALYAALRHPRARVVAFEPEYANAHYLKDNVIANQLEDRIHAYAMALSNHTGLSRLHLQDVTAGSAMHTEAKMPLTMTRAQQPVVWSEGVCAYTLDAFCDEMGWQPQWIKLDVDGTEPEILEGGQRTLRSPALRSLLIEIPEDPRAGERCRELLRSAGLQPQPANAACRTHNEIWGRHGR